MAKSSMALIPEKLDPEEKSRIADASKLSLGILGDSVSTFLERDLKRANRIIERAEDLLEAYQDIQFRALRHSLGVAIAMSNLADSLRRIGEYGRGICEQTINHVVSLEDELKLS